MMISDIASYKNGIKFCVAFFCNMPVSEKHKNKILQFCQEKKYKRFKLLVEAALKNWETKDPAPRKYGLFYKAGKFATKPKCCLVSSALDGKQILEAVYDKSLKISRLYEFCAEIHYNLSREEISGLIRGFDQKEINLAADKDAYLLGCMISSTLFGS